MKKILFIILLFTSIQVSAQKIQYSQGDYQKAIGFNGGIYVGSVIYFGCTSDTTYSNISKSSFSSFRAGASIYDTVLNCLWVHTNKNNINPGWWERVEMVIKRKIATSIDSTSTATDTAIYKGLIVSTSLAPTSITLPTATQLANVFHASKGTLIEFLVDNTSGSNTVTIIPGSDITATSVVTGSNNMTIAASATTGLACFRITFISNTKAVISRIF